MRVIDLIGFLVGSRRSIERLIGDVMNGVIFWGSVTLLVWAGMAQAASISHKSSRWGGATVLGLGVPVGAFVVTIVAVAAWIVAAVVWGP